MSIVNAIVVYFVIWWISLFLFLPIEVSKSKKVKDGNDPGAPENPKLKKKFFFTSIFSFIVWILILLWVGL